MSCELPTEGVFAEALREMEQDSQQADQNRDQAARELKARPVAAAIALCLV